MHVSENRVIVSNIAGNTNFIFLTLLYRNDNVSMHHISSCIMSSCIMLYHQHKSYGTYVLCKEGWGKVQNDYMQKAL